VCAGDVDFSRVEKKRPAKIVSASKLGSLSRYGSRWLRPAQAQYRSTEERRSALKSCDFQRLRRQTRSHALRGNAVFDAPRRPPRWARARPGRGREGIPTKGVGTRL